MYVVVGMAYDHQRKTHLVTLYNPWGTADQGEPIYKTPEETQALGGEKGDGVFKLPITDFDNTFNTVFIEP